MCGISGIFRRTPAASAPDRDELGRIHAALAARGPDGQGLWSSPDGRLLLAHRRLSILDLLPAGAQPMSSADGRFTVVFNGEIYNFHELAGELVAAGVRLRSRSDTEVILELWRREGPRAFARLRGMFALALWDDLTAELVLARDPYGIKPLFYSLDGGQLRFASQARALEAGGGLSLEVDPAAVAGLLSWGAVPEPLSLRKSIRALPAGHWARVGGDGAFVLATIPRAGLDDGPSDGPGDARAALAASVRAHLVSDVPVGVFLSAGLDSALIADLAVREARGAPGEGEPLTALTLTWAEARGTSASARAGPRWSK